MGKRRKGNKVDGWLIVDKPLGLTSTQVIGRVRRVFSPQKIGHGGTLDPLATGILPIAMGEATKTMPYTVDAKKTYRFTVQWGNSTTTDDAEGDIVQSSDHRPSRQDIEAALPGFLGEIKQTPPIFSAIKVDGKRAYDLARAGEEVVLKSRKVQIYQLTLEEIPDLDHATLSVECAKGTYVRSLARDLAQKLGTFGHVSMLRRLAVGNFDEARAISLEKLEALSHSAPAFDLILGIETALDDIPALAVTPEEAACVSQGQAINVIGKAPERAPGPPLLSQESKLSSLLILQRGETGEKPVAIGAVDGGVFRPTRVFNL
jgi:tRNA pseudouridine55 synthase